MKLVDVKRVARRLLAGDLITIEVEKVGGEGIAHVLESLGAEVEVFGTDNGRGGSPARRRRVD